MVAEAALHDDEGKSAKAPGNSQSVDKLITLCIFMFISIPGCLLLSISSVLTRPDVSHLGESQKLDNQYATLVTTGLPGGGGAAPSLSNQQTTEEVAVGSPEWLSIEKSRLETERENGNGILHNYGNENGLLTISFVPRSLIGRSAQMLLSIERHAFECG